MPKSIFYFASFRPFYIYGSTLTTLFKTSLLFLKVKILHFAKFKILNVNK